MAAMRSAIALFVVLACACSSSSAPVVDVDELGHRF
jgi:hypothetical protein